MSDPVIVEIEIAAPVATVWRALRDPAEIGAVRTAPSSSAHASA